MGTATPWDAHFAAAEQKYGLPPGILKATAYVESTFDPKAASGTGPAGLMQISRTNARNYGINQYDPVQSIEAAGKLWQANLKQTGGDIDAAARLYNGNSDPHYVPKIASALGRFGHGAAPAAANPQAPQPQKGGDPFENALSGGDASDPFEVALAGDKESHAPLASSARPQGAGGQGDHSGGDLYEAHSDGRAQANGPGVQGRDGSRPTGGQEAELQPHRVGFGTRLGHVGETANGLVDGILTGATADLIHPVTAGLNTILPLDKLTNSGIKSVWDGSSLSDAYHNNLDIERANTARFQAEDPYGTTIADVGGAIASPFNKIGAPIEGAGLLKNGLRIMGSGALYGGIRGGSELGTLAGAGEGAVVGGLTAPVGAAVGAAGGRALAAVAKPALLAKGLKAAWGRSAKAQIAQMIDSGATVDEVVQAFPDAAQGKTFDSIKAAIAYRQQGGKAPISFADPVAQPTEAAAPAASPEASPKPAPQAYAAALGTQGSRRGVEAVSEMPPQVADDLARLQQAGVSAPEAQAEADIRYIGGKPTVATVTRNPAEQRAMFEGAKASTAEGQALADTIAGNNQALHSTIIKTVDDLGGVPAHGEAAEAAADALAKASDAEKAKVAKLYYAAEREHGYMPPSPSEPNLDAPDGQPHYSSIPPKMPETPDEFDYVESRPVKNANGKTVHTRGPLDLLSFLRTRGGIQDQAGELSHMGITNKPRDLDFARNEGFLGRLINPQGMYLDDAAELATDHGYFSQQPTVAEFLEHIRNTHNGYGGERIFHPDDGNELAAFNAAQDERYFLERRAWEDHEPLDFTKDATEADLARRQVPAEAYAADADRSGGFVNAKPLYDALKDVSFKAPLSQEGRALASGFKDAVDTLSEGGKRGLSPQNLERLRKMVNATYNPMGGEVNSLGGTLKGTIDKLFDELGEASPAYKAARKAHKEWAEKYDDPEGLARLIMRDVKGNFVNADQWRLSENALVSRMNDKPFAQVVRQLKTINATDALNRLKAGIVQNAYERATNSARDLLGNPTVNGKLFQQELNKIGITKLNALFSRDELAHLATIGRAARHLNEAVPGAVNTSNTASSLVQALQAGPDRAKAKAMARLLAHGAASIGSPILGNAAVEIGGHGAEALGKRAVSKAVKQGVREQLNPALARAVAKRSVAKIEEAQRRAAIGRKLMKPASTGAVAAERRNAL